MWGVFEKRMQNNAKQIKTIHAQSCRENPTIASDQLSFFDARGRTAAAFYF
jgi:hypothetical protein